MARTFLATALALGALASTASLAQQPPPAPASPNPDTPRKVGGSVLPPILTKSKEPRLPRNEFGKPESGNVLVGMVVDRKGNPTDLKILRSGGDDLDRSAIEAVSHYRFKPATENGLPIPVQLNVDINFGVPPRR